MTAVRVAGQHVFQVYIVPRHADRIQGPVCRTKRVNAVFNILQVFWIPRFHSGLLPRPLPVACSGILYGGESDQNRNNL